MDMPVINYIEAVTQALDEEMARDSKVFVLGRRCRCQRQRF